MHISSLAFPFPILFLTSPYFVPTNYALSLYLFPHSLPSPSLLITLQMISHNPLSVLLICLVWFLDSVVDSYVFIAILMFIVLIFFFLNKSL